MLKSLAGRLAHSRLLKHGAMLWHRNETEWNLPLTKFQKLITGIYIILHDYHAGLFPPRHDDMAKVYAGEINYRLVLPGLSKEQIREGAMRKPFWFGPLMKRYITSFLDVTTAFSKNGVVPPQKVLELGCGSGWMSEFLACTGFDVLGTTLSQEDIADGLTRLKSLQIKGIPCKLNFLPAPMESIHQVLGPEREESFDAVFVYEALHHAFDWKLSIQSAYKCLKKGGFFFLFNEPNLMQIFVSYRVARLSNTHEIGFRPSRLKDHLKTTGFTEVHYVKNKCHLYTRPVSLVARK